MHQIFSVHTTPEKFKTQPFNPRRAILDLRLTKTPAGKWNNYRNLIVSEKRRFQKDFYPH